nr:MAG TPA: hypothetical protein [Caudoviricetes sp.]
MCVHIISQVFPKHNQRKRSSETFSDGLFSCLPVSQKKQHLTTTYSILSV